MTLAECLKLIYEKPMTPAVINVWFGILQRYELAEVQAAFASYITDPNDCRYAPRPSDIIRCPEQASADDGRPGADEAWGMLIRRVNDERETGVLTEEMRIWWTTCQPILDHGNKVGARLAFRETYAREVEKARKMVVAPRLMPTLSKNPILRQSWLREVLEARRTGVDAVTALLSGLIPTAINQVAGLLTGPGASTEQAKIASNMRH